MYRRGQAVQSASYGMGQVLKDGDPPLVRWLDGRECVVPQSSVIPLAQRAFEREIASRFAWECVLFVRVYGLERLRAAGPSWVRDEDGLWSKPASQCCSTAATRGTGLTSDSPEVHNCIRAVEPSESLVGTAVIDCDVTRLNSPELGSRPV